MVEIERREFLEGAYLRVSFLLFRKKMPLQDSTNTQTRSNNSEIEVSKKEEEVKMTGEFLILVQFWTTTPSVGRNRPTDGWCRWKC